MPQNKDRFQQSQNYLPDIGFGIPTWLRNFLLEVKTRLEQIGRKPDIPGQVTGIRTRARAWGINYIVWDPVPGAARYRIYRTSNTNANTGKANFAIAEIVAEVTTTSYIDNNIISDSTLASTIEGQYPPFETWYWVSALNSTNQEGILSAAYKATSTNWIFATSPATLFLATQQDNQSDVWLYPQNGANGFWIIDVNGKLKPQGPAGANGTQDIGVVATNEIRAIYITSAASGGIYVGGVAISTLGASQVVQTASGTYTPTLTSVANLDSTTALACQYLRVGSVVTVSGGFRADPTTTATATKVGISLPIASNFTANNDLGGCANAFNIAGQSAGIYADPTNDRAEAAWISGDTTDQGMYFSFTYQIK